MEAVVLEASYWWVLFKSTNASARIDVDTDYGGEDSENSYWWIAPLMIDVMAILMWVLARRHLHYAISYSTFVLACNYACYGTVCLTSWWENVSWRECFENSDPLTLLITCFKRFHTLCSDIVSQCTKCRTKPKPGHTSTLSCSNIPFLLLFSAHNHVW